MEILYRSATPAYKGCKPPAQASTGLFSGFGCALFGGGAPAYRTLDACGAPAPSPSRCWWQLFPATPAYKPAPRKTHEGSEPAAPSPDDAPSDERECPDGDPYEIHIYEG